MRPMHFAPALAAAAFVAACSVTAASPQAAPAAPAAPAAAAAAAPKAASDPRVDALLAWAEPIFPWGAGETTVDEVGSVRLKGYRLLRLNKKYAVDARMAEQAFIALDDAGKAGIIGDAVVDEPRMKSPIPVRTELDLMGMREQLKRYLRGPFKLVLDPAGDRLPTFRGVRILADTGYGTYEMTGFISADDGALLLLGKAWDRKRSINEQRREMIKLANTPYSGPADATVTVVEYSDMECPFCKKRTSDWEPLLDKLGKDLKIRRYFKQFPLVNDHPWAFRSSSAGLCFFQKDPNLFLRWKSNVYARQDQLTVSDLDIFALDFATANEMPEDAFRSCYLQQKTVQKIHADLTEGFGIRVRATPSYFIDGVLVSWFADPIMEDYLRRTYLAGKPAPAPAAKAPAKKK